MLLLLAKLVGLAPFADWSWWVIAVPFIGAVVWWTFVDASGITARRVADRIERKQEQRRIKAMESLGLNTAAERRRAGAGGRRPAAPRNADAPPAARDASPPRRDPER